MKRTVATQVGERIKSLRLQSRGGKLTQERLAERADISVSFLSMIERGERSAHVDTLAEFVQRHRLTRREVERLLTVAQALFGD